MSMDEKVKKLKELMPTGSRFEAKCIHDWQYRTKAGDICRCMTEGKAVFVYAKGKRRYGYRVAYDEFVSYFEPKIKSAEDETIVWHRALNNIRNHLLKSGLWPNVLQEVEMLLKMNYADFMLLYEYRWCSGDFTKSWGTAHVVSNKSAAEKQALAQQVIQKYPFVRDTTNSCGLNTALFSEMYVRPKLKSMFFGALNKHYKEQIALALNEKRTYSTGRVRCNYDVSFEYNAERRMAWYSEEYKDCGNGHYYIALDGGTALFCEDD